MDIYSIIISAQGKMGAIPTRARRRDKHLRICCIFSPQRMNAIGFFPRRSADVL
ncbi:MAG: hypothetical protein IKN39_00355 [Clostridia bacterium]|nr:hypothetical protein [Clostridia bacterium]